MTIPDNIKKYRERYSVGTAWQLSAGTIDGVDNVVVIPALAESGHLFGTLASLADNPPRDLVRTLVLCVVNNRSPHHTPPEECADNQVTLSILRDLGDGKMPETPGYNHSLSTFLKKILRSNLKTAYVDASSPGHEMPDKTGGVGLARKIGLDLALNVFDYEKNGVNVLFSLDADTLVEKNYLSAVRSFFEKEQHHAAVIEFSHQIPEDPHEQAAIYCYEMFLRYYILGLYFAGSPYVIHSVGSTIVCSADGYAAVRGMNKRKAGEDFYFLNKIAKIKGIGVIDTTRVYPSSRVSSRVPFGTGRRVIRFLNGEYPEHLLYDPAVFVIVKQWLEYVVSHPEADEDTIIHRAREIHPSLEEFLGHQRFHDVWRRLKKNSRSPSILVRHFLSWFDGFKTLKLINYLTRNGIPPIDMFRALRQLLEMMGKGTQLTVGTDGVPSLQIQAEILDCLRHVEHEVRTG
ncbi:MAG: hypothetical protein JXC33_00800 [Deltaproteobacteria bacterium]|nr:hypothetical protein [Deltaproteobacteria bacterium]